MGADIRLHRLPVLRRVKKPDDRPSVSKWWCWLGEKGFWSLLVLVWGGISQRLRPRAEGGRRNGNPTNAFALLSLAVIVDNSFALYAQLQFLLELRPREARPENSSRFSCLIVCIWSFLFISLFILPELAAPCAAQGPGPLAHGPII